MVVEKLTRRNRAIAKAFASPIILRILANFYAADVEQAAAENLDLVDSFVANPAYLETLRNVFRVIPFVKDGVVKRALPSIASEPWLRWFIGNECLHRRPDLYPLFAYNEKIFGWLLRNMEQLSQYLEQNL